MWLGIRQAASSSEVPSHNGAAAAQGSHHTVEQLLVRGPVTQWGSICSGVPSHSGAATESTISWDRKKLVEKKSGDEFLCLKDGAVGFVFKLLSGTQELEALVSRPDNLGSYDHGSYGG